MQKFVFYLVMIFLLTGCAGKDLRSASREPAGIAPIPEQHPDAVIQVYGAPAWSWRGWFAIHTWISVKPSNADQYTVYEVVGWRTYYGLPALRIYEDYPDRYWFGERPELILDRRGEGVDELIARIDDAAREYPWANTYRVFPGPNSNTFPAWIAREVPELELELPFKAIGSGYID